MSNGTGQFLKYKVRNTSFQCYKDADPAVDPVYFKGEYYVMSLEDNVPEGMDPETYILSDYFLFVDYQKEKIHKEEAPFLYEADDLEKIAGDDDYVVGLFHLKEEAVSLADRLQKIEYLKSLSYSQKYELMVGFGSLSMHCSQKNKVVMYGSHIDPLHRGNGCAKMLCQARLDWAVKNNFKAAITRPHIDNVASLMTSKAYGFQPPHDVDMRRLTGEKIIERELKLKHYAHEIARNAIVLAI